MKKMIVFLLCIVTLFGCTIHKEENKSPELNEYLLIKEKLKNAKDFQENLDFNITLMFNELENEYCYDVIISRPKVEMYDIVAMAYADENEQETCPTIGIFDENSFHLKPDFIDKPNGFYKGIQLSGTTKLKQNIMLYISYYSQKEKIELIEKIIEVKVE